MTGHKFPVPFALAYIEHQMLFLVDFSPESDEGMSGCLDNAHCPTCEIDLGEKRNTIASVVAGGLVSDLTKYFILSASSFSQRRIVWLLPSFNSSLY